MFEGMGSERDHLDGPQALCYPGEMGQQFCVCMQFKPHLGRSPLPQSHLSRWSCKEGLPPWVDATDPVGKRGGDKTCQLVEFWAL